MQFYLLVHKDGFKGVGTFENDLYTGRLENSSEIFTQARDIWDRDDNFLLTSKQVSGSSVQYVGFFSGFFMI